jgi:hypothetical protein
MLSMRPFPAAFVPVLALAAGLFAAPDLLRGQEISSPYDFIDTRHQAGVFVGYAGENRGQLDLSPGGGPLLGARYGIELSGPFALEATAFFIPTERNVYDPSTDPEEGLPPFLGTSSSLIGGLDARLRFTLTGDRTWYRLAPFVTMGGGLASDLTQRSSLEDELASDERFSLGPSFLGVLGAGTRWLPSDNLTIRFDATFHIWKAGTPRAFFEFEEQFGSVPEGEWTGVGGLTLGSSIRW